jgi:hypothetical protein
MNESNTREVFDSLMMIVDAREVYNFNLIQKFSIFREYLLNDNNLNPAIYDSFSQINKSLELLNARNFIDKSTPFFWKNLITFIQQITRKQENLEIIYQYWVLTAFDAYFEYLPDDTCWQIPKPVQSNILLPKLGIEISNNNKFCKIKKINEQTIELIECDTAQDRTIIDVRSVMPNYCLPTIGLDRDQSTKLLLSKDPLLYESRYIDDVFIEIENAASFATMLDCAIRFIAQCDRSIAEKIDRSISWYIPIYTPQIGVIHCSRTSSNLQGAILISDANSYLETAEAIVHEFSHSELFILMDAETVLLEEPNKLFYSPWRSDPRPLNGLFHALYVFSNLANFYLRAIHSDLTDVDLEFCQKRYLEICCQLYIALAQVITNQLSEVGVELVSAMWIDLENHIHNLYLDHQTIPEFITQHLNDWCQQHEQLIHLIDTHELFKSVSTLTKILEK